MEGSIAARVNFSWNQEQSLDENDTLIDPFWTADQIEMMDGYPRLLYVTLGIIVAAIALFGVTANFVVLYVFSRFKRLRTPANVFIMNLTVSDLCACLLHPLSAYSALIDGRWSFGRIGCNVYGMGVGYFGLNTIVSLAAIAWERYFVITAKPTASQSILTRCQARKVCGLIWLYCAALVAPPLMGWSSYRPEGILISCSWDYTTRTLSNRLYYIYLLTFGFLLPVAVLLSCYISILRHITMHSRELGRLMPSVDNTRRRKADVQTAKSIWMLAVLYMVSWTPYAIVSLIGQFGLEDSITPVTATIPAFLAKTCILFDPLLYGFSHPQFRKSFKQMVGTPMSTNTITRGSSHTPPTSYAKRRVTRNFSSESSLRSQKPTPTLSVRRDIERRLSCNSRGTPSSIRKHTAEDNTDRLNSFKEGALGSFNVKDGVNPHHPSDSNPVGSRSLRVVNETDAITQSDVSGDSCHGARDVMCIVSSHHPLVVKSSLCTTNHDGQPV